MLGNSCVWKVPPKVLPKSYRMAVAWVGKSRQPKHRFGGPSPRIDPDRLAFDEIRRRQDLQNPCENRRWRTRPFLEFLPFFDEVNRIGGRRIVTGSEF